MEDLSGVPLLLQAHLAMQPSRIMCRLLTLAAKKVPCWKFSNEIPGHLYADALLEGHVERLILQLEFGLRRKRIYCILPQSHLAPRKNTSSSFTYFQHAAWHLAVPCSLLARICALRVYGAVDGQLPVAPWK